MLDWSDLLIRLAAATAIGGAIGLNRDLHHKAAGLRTLGLVALVSAAVTLGAIESAGIENATRVIQGLLTGVGFLGAGVIVRGDSGHKVHVLTTAASVWAATAIGALCAMGLWPLIGVTAILVLALLSFGGRLEKRLHAALERNERPEKDARQADQDGDRKEVSPGGS